MKYAVDWEYLRDEAELFGDGSLAMNRPAPCRPDHGVHYWQHPHQSACNCGARSAAVSPEAPHA